MIKHLVAGMSLFLLTGVSFAQSTPSPDLQNKETTHTLTLQALQTGADTVKISGLLKGSRDRITSIRYDLSTGKVILTSEPGLRTNDIMEMLLAGGYTSYYITGDGKKIIMQPSGKVETRDVKH